MTNYPVAMPSVAMSSVLAAGMPSSVSRTGIGSLRNIKLGRSYEIRRHHLLTHCSENFLGTKIRVGSGGYTFCGCHTILCVTQFEEDSEKMRKHEQNKTGHVQEHKYE